jgi:hypothetical protein
VDAFILSCLSRASYEGAEVWTRHREMQLEVLNLHPGGEHLGLHRFRLFTSRC